MREAAEGLAARGWEVDVLTSCARTTTPGATSTRRGHQPREPDPPAVPGDPAGGPRNGTPSAGASWLGLPLSYDDQCRWNQRHAPGPALFRYLLEHAERYQPSSPRRTCRGSPSPVSTSPRNGPCSCRACTTSPTPTWISSGVVVLRHGDAGPRQTCLGGAEGPAPLVLGLGEEPERRRVWRASPRKRSRWA